MYTLYSKFGISYDIPVHFGAEIRYKRSRYIWSLLCTHITVESGYSTHIYNGHMRVLLLGSVY